MVAADVVEHCLELELILWNIGDIVLSEAVVGGCMSSGGGCIDVGSHC